MFTYFTDRDGKFQLCALAESSFDPLARTTKFMLTEEAHHMFVGESGVSRVIQRTCAAMNDLKTDDPAKLRAAGVIAAGVAVDAAPTVEPVAPTLPAAAAGEASFNSSAYCATVPPWSAAHAFTNLYGPKCAQKFVTATVAGNVRVTEVGREYDTHHLVLDFGVTPFPVLEGQSIGVIPPGTDASGRPHHPRQYSIASPRNGERPGYNNLSLTIKRVLEDHQGRPVRGVASNYMCDLKKGDKVQVIGPFGASFLMPNHPRSHIVMICTGTSSAPMRAMTEWRRRLRKSGKFEGGRLMLFFGARARGAALLRPAAKPAEGISSTSVSPSAARRGSRSATCRT